MERGTNIIVNNVKIGRSYKLRKLLMNIAIKVNNIKNTIFQLQ